MSLQKQLQKPLGYYQIHTAVMKQVAESLI